MHIRAKTQAYYLIHLYIRSTIHSLVYAMSWWLATQAGLEMMVMIWLHYNALLQHKAYMWCDAVQDIETFGRSDEFETIIMFTLCWMSPIRPIRPTTASIRICTNINEGQRMGWVIHASVINYMWEGRSPIDCRPWSHRTDDCAGLILALAAESENIRTSYEVIDCHLLHDVSK